MRKTTGKVANRLIGKKIFQDDEVVYRTEYKIDRLDCEDEKWNGVYAIILPDDNLFFYPSKEMPQLNGRYYIPDLKDYAIFGSIFGGFFGTYFYIDPEEDICYLNEDALRSFKEIPSGNE